MTSDPGPTRDVLVDLVEIRSSMDAVVGAIRELPWDSDIEVVLLAPDNVESLLLRYLNGEFSADDLEAWANALESREDIGLESGHEELLGAFVFETANPFLAEPISEQYARRWLERLSGSHGTESSP